MRAFDTTPEQVVVLAVDMPRVSPATIRRLMLDGGRDGSVLVDQDGRKQYLCGVYAVARLLKSAEDQPRSMKALLKPLKLAKVAAIGDEAKDVDSWQDLSALAT
ncbi:MAG: NTP transferase domain-containing protein [Marmoricola sp.]